MPLDGGRFATSDLNDLYRRVINLQQPVEEADGTARSRRHHVRNERMLTPQEAVDAVI